MSTCDEVITSDDELEISNSKLKIYPNPTQDEFVIESSNTMKEIIITDMLGRKVLIQTITSTKTKLNVEGLSSGVYIIEIKTVSGISAKRKLIVQ